MHTNDTHPQAPHATLSHHSLRVWHEARALVRAVAHQKIQDAELRDQAMRACRSVALNIAEGAALDGGDRRRHFRAARASVVETVAAYELAADLGENLRVDEVTAIGRNIVAMLAGLIRDVRSQTRVTGT